MTELTGDLIHGFATSLLMKNFDNPVATPDFHKELWDLCCSPNPKVAIAAPRGHAKSTTITHAYALAAICFRIRDHVLIVSDTEDQAKAFVGDLKTELRENEELQALFGFQKLIKDRETEFVGRFEDGALFRVICKGSEQKLRGLKWRNKRPNLIIGDDLENDEIVLNDERRDKFRRWFYNALLPAGSRHCIIRVVGTILHMDALLERLMPKPNAATTVKTPLKDYSTDESRIWKSVRYRAHDREFEHILWPEHLDEKSLRAIRQDYIDQGFPEGYSQEYLNYPIDEDNAFFRKEDFLAIEEDGATEEYYIAADFAISERKQAAYTVFVVVGVTPNHTIRVRDVVRFRGDAYDIIDTMFELDNYYKPECFFVEQENIARALGPVIQREMVERNQFLAIEKMLPQADKIRRARGIQARVRAGSVEFDTEAEWYADFHTELLQFPRGAYRDQVDSFAWIGIGLDKIVEAATKAEIEEELYERELEDAYDATYFGASSVTGY